MRPPHPIFGPFWRTPMKWCINVRKQMTPGLGSVSCARAWLEYGRALGILS